MTTNENACEKSPKLEAAEKCYEQICASIRATDEISFKLLGLVPLLSGALIVVVLKGEVTQSPLLWFISTFGTVVTFGLFRWELRNIDTCKWLRDQAEEIESKEFGWTKGQFACRKKAPTLFGYEIGKTEAEKIIYNTTIVAWLALPWMRQLV